MKNNYSKSEKESVYALRYFQASLFQKILLTGGSAYMSLLHTTKRPDMMAVLGEVTGNKARKKMYEEMLNDDEGLQILRDQPRINTSTTDFEALSRMPSGTLGKVYLDFLQSHKISPDKRPIVQFIEDPELAYVMQRFREIHDLIHVILNVPTNILGEVVVKWVEGIQTGLPVCLLAAVFGPLQLSPKARKKYLNYYLPWAVQTGFEARFLMNVYFEKRWDQKLEDLLKELNITPCEEPK